jgi:uncharacterized membrane protein YdbT with pleckstrin-like domain
LSTRESTAIIWTDRPWITPDAVARTIIVIILGAIIIFLENLDNAASATILNIPVWTWTAIAFLLVWIASVIPLVILRTSHKYTLRSGSLEVKTGLASLQSFVLSPSGFSDLEIHQSIVGRILNFGDITIHTQSDRTAVMQKVRDPNRVASQIRDYMGKPTVRIDNPPPNPQ